MPESNLHVTLTGEYVGFTAFSHTMGQVAKLHQRASHAAALADYASRLESRWLTQDVPLVTWIQGALPRWPLETIGPLLDQVSRDGSGGTSPLTVLLLQEIGWPQLLSERPMKLPLAVRKYAYDLAVKFQLYWWSAETRPDRSMALVARDLALEITSPPVRWYDDPNGRLATEFMWAINKLSLPDPPEDDAQIVRAEKSNPLVLEVVLGTAALVGGIAAFPKIRSVAWQLVDAYIRKKQAEARVREMEAGIRKMEMRAKIDTSRIIKAAADSLEDHMNPEIAMATIEAIAPAAESVAHDFGKRGVSLKLGGASLETENS